MVTINYLTSRLDSIAETLSGEDQEMLKLASEVISSNFEFYEPVHKAIWGYGLKNGPLVHHPTRYSPDRPYIPNPPR